MYEIFVDIYRILWCYGRFIKLMKIREDVFVVKALVLILIIARYFKEVVYEDGDLL